MTYEEFIAFSGTIGQIGLVIFIVAIALVFIYAFFSKNEKSFDRASQLPLKEDPDEDMRRGHYGR